MTNLPIHTHLVQHVTYVQECNQILRSSNEVKLTAVHTKKRGVTASTPSTPVKNIRRLSIPTIVDDTVTPGDFLETITTLQSNCKKRAVKVKGDQIVYDDKTAQNLFKWQEKNSELLSASSDKHPSKNSDKVHTSNYGCNSTFHSPSYFQMGAGQASEFKCKKWRKGWPSSILRGWIFSDTHST